MFHNLCDFIKEELRELDRKVASGSGLSMSEVEYADKLSHMKKSILAVEAMENPEEYGYNDGGYNRGYNEGYNDGYSDSSSGYGNYSEGNSGSGYGARGRGRNARRDSMSRYATGSRMYRDDKDMMTELQELMNKAPNEQVKQKYQQFISEVKNMM